MYFANGQSEVTIGIVGVKRNSPVSGLGGFGVLSPEQVDITQRPVGLGEFGA